MRVVLHPAVENDIRRAMDWYNRHRPGLGDEFLEQVDASIQGLQQSPRRYARFLLSLRRVLVHRFPFQLVFRVRGDHVLIVGLFHQHADPTSIRLDTVQRASHS